MSGLHPACSMNTLALLHSCSMSPACAAAQTSATGPSACTGACVHACGGAWFEWVWLHSYTCVRPPLACTHTSPPSPHNSHPPSPHITHHTSPPSTIAHHCHHTSHITAPHIIHPPSPHYSHRNEDVEQRTTIVNVVVYTMQSEVCNGNRWQLVHVALFTTMPLSTCNVQANWYCNISQALFVVRPSHLYVCSHMCNCVHALACAGLVCC